MQTSLTVEQHARSNESLARLRATATAQLTMQHNVEGLSTVALTYYSLGVLGYAAKATAGTGRCPWRPRWRSAPPSRSCGWRSAPPCADETSRDDGG